MTLNSIQVSVYTITWEFKAMCELFYTIGSNMIKAQCRPAILRLGQEAKGSRKIELTLCQLYRIIGLTLYHFDPVIGLTLCVEAKCSNETS